MTTIILLMAGMGKRMNCGKNKMFLSVLGKPLFMYTIEKFKDYNQKILLVVSKEDYDYFKDLNLGYELVIGGKTRQESVYNALLHVKTDRVLIHDGARPLVSKRIISNCLENDYDAYFVAIKPVDTIRYNQQYNFKDLKRDDLLDVQTPQGGKTSLFLQSSKKMVEENIMVTDDISMLDDKTKVKVINGSEKNIKVTRPLDLKIMQLLMEEKDD